MGQEKQTERDRESDRDAEKEGDKIADEPAENRADKINSKPEVPDSFDISNLSLFLLPQIPRGRLPKLPWFGSGSGPDRSAGAKPRSKPKLLRERPRSPTETSCSPEPRSEYESSPERVIQTRVEELSDTADEERVSKCGASGVRGKGPSCPSSRIWKGRGREKKRERCGKGRAKTQA